MKTLVVPDVHQRVSVVKSILEAESNYDEVVFLGDWFDSFHEPPKVAGFEETCEYLKHLILEHPNKHKFVFLLGNHDISYIHENRDSSSKRISKNTKYFCSGFTTCKAKKFRHAFFDHGLKDNFFVEHFKIAHLTQGFVLSHAGISIRHFPYGYSKERFVNELLPDVWRNFRNLEYNHNWVISGAGYHRGGNHAIGGVLWMDWNGEFNPCIDTGKQIMGHTTVRAPDCMHMNTLMECWNLDTEKDYGIIWDGRMTTKPVPAQSFNNKLSSRVANLSDHGGTLRHDS
jgi:hypothetical protein